MDSFCKCGCGKIATSKTGFFKGHWNKGKVRLDVSQRNRENNPMFDLSTKEKVSKSMKGKSPWNKGKNKETNESVRKYTDSRNANIIEIAEKIRQTKIEKYKTGESVPYWKGKKRPDETRVKMRNSTLARLERQGTSISFNEESILFFEDLNNLFNLAGKFGKFEHKHLGYSLDFYSEKYNLVIEWDEPHHYNKGILREKDRLRQEEIEKSLSCTFIRIKSWEVKTFDYEIIKKLTTNT